MIVAVLAALALPSLVFRVYKWIIQIRVRRGEHGTPVAPAGSVGEEVAAP